MLDFRGLWCNLLLLQKHPADGQKEAKAHTAEVCADYCLSAANEITWTAAPEAKNFPFQKESITLKSARFYSL